MPSGFAAFVICFGTLVSPFAPVDTPTPLAHQGVVAVHGERFTGTGAFRFALVRVPTGVNLWTHDGSKIGASCAGREDACRPETALPLAVVNGVYNVLLGDAASGGMPPIPRAVFNDAEIALRVWFDDLRGHGVHRLSPDVQVTAAPYALRLPNVYVDEPTGNVGVGTASPSESLDVERAGPAIVEVTSQSGEAGVRLRSDATGEVEIASPAGSDALRLRTGGADRVNVSAFGNVGIGTTDPQHRLDVVGSARMLGLEAWGIVAGSGFAGWDRDEADDVTRTTEFGGDVSGPFAAIDVLDDTHSHTDAKVADDLSINNGLLYAMAGGDAVGVGTSAPQATLHVAGSFKIGDVLSVDPQDIPPSNCCYAHPEPGCDDSACADMVCGELTQCCTLEWDENCVEFGQLWAPEQCGALCQSPQVEILGRVRAFGARTLMVSSNFQPPEAGVYYTLAEGVAESDGFVIATAIVRAPNAVFQIHGWTVPAEMPLVRASVNSVSGSDYPVHSNSFTMPVRIGETWRVTVVRDAVQNQSQYVYVCWQPLGQ